jgi:tripartite-type tricarboxylate transporter receptor subunit TctC
MRHEKRRESGGVAARLMGWPLAGEGEVMRKFQLALNCLLAAVCVAPGGATFAQNYPAKIIRIVVPFPPGGPTDLYARIIGQKMQEAWGQSVIVDNRPGGTGLVGSDLVRQAPADGYTLLLTSNSAHVMGPLLREPRSFDPVRDFTPLSMVIRYPMYILVNASLPVRTLGELIALAKARPAQLNYSSVGTGSGGHLACELFNVAAGTNIVHVPYKGAAPAQTALVAGEAQVMCDSVGNSQTLVVAGKLRGLAVTGAQRSPAVPDVPTLMELGFPLEAYIWLGILGPPAMSGALVAKLNAEIVRIMNLPEVRDRVLKGGSELIAGSPEKFAEDMRSESEVWGRVIREKGIKAE